MRVASEISFIALGVFAFALAPSLSAQNGAASPLTVELMVERDSFHSFEEVIFVGLISNSSDQDLTFFPKEESGEEDIKLIIRRLPDGVETEVPLVNLFSRGRDSMYGCGSLPRNSRRTFFVLNSSTRNEFMPGEYELKLVAQTRVQSVKFSQEYQDMLPLLMWHKAQLDNPDHYLTTPQPGIRISERSATLSSTIEIEPVTSSLTITIEAIEDPIELEVVSWLTGEGFQKIHHLSKSSYCGKIIESRDEFLAYWPQSKFAPYAHRAVLLSKLQTLVDSGEYESIPTLFDNASVGNQLNKAYFKSLFILKYWREEEPEARAKILNLLGFLEEKFSEQMPDDPLLKLWKEASVDRLYFQ